MNRRRFFKNSLLGILGSHYGWRILHGAHFPVGMIPAAYGEPGTMESLLGKDPGLTLLNDRPWNVETPPHLLDDRVTPGHRLFVRNNGLIPREADASKWVLSVGGESAGAEKSYTLEELKARFTHHTYQLVLECGGNGRSEFNPPARGNQWTTGAVGCPEWNGIRLRDVLEDVGMQDDVVYIAYRGADRHLSGDPEKDPISRGVPVAKALEAESLIAWGMNGEPLPLANGYPLRLVFGGWPGSTSGKWLTEILIRDQVHDGTKMGGYSYRVPKHPVAPGTEVPEEAMEIIHAMPVKSLITRPKTGAVLKLDESLSVGGHTWVGEGKIDSMETSIDFGQTWQRARLEPPRNRFAWQHWEASLTFPEIGYYEVWARATDAQGVSQPMVLPGWNPKGYLNNACHRIAVRVVNT